MSHQNLIVSLHQAIQQLQKQHPDRWRVMLNAIVENPEIFDDLAKLKASAARPSSDSTFTQKRLEGILHRAIGVQ